MSTSLLPGETWVKAIQIFNTELTRDPTKRVDLVSQPCASFEEVHGLAVCQRDRIQKGKWKIKNVVLRDKCDGFLEVITAYARIGDVLSQSSQYASLAWGSFKLLLQVTPV